MKCVCVAGWLGVSVCTRVRVCVHECVQGEGVSRVHEFSTAKFNALRYGVHILGQE